MKEVTGPSLVVQELCASGQAPRLLWASAFPARSVDCHGCLESSPGLSCYRHSQSFSCSHTPKPPCQLRGAWVQHNCFYPVSKAWSKGLLTSGRWPSQGVRNGDGSAQTSGQALLRALSNTALGRAHWLWWVSGYLEARSSVWTMSCIGFTWFISPAARSHWAEGCCGVL